MSRKTLDVGEGIRLPALEAQTQTQVVYGGKGMGKTNYGAVLAEELARHALKFSWVDPVGVAWGLRHSADGRGKGVEVVILGGTHGDLKIEPTAGEIVADFVVDEAVSVIVDISRRADGRMWSVGEKVRFMRDYCNRLFQRQGEELRPIMQIIDEAGRFVPQAIPKGAVDIAACVGAIEQLVELGRNVGVGVTLITQRSARMNKSVSELADVMVAFRTVGPRSIDAIIDWFGEHLHKSQWAPMVEALRKLPKGTALVVSPGWLQLEGEYAMRARHTFDSSETPVAGKERKPRGKGAQPDLSKYRERMAETVEKAEANDPTALAKKLRQSEERWGKVRHVHTGKNLEKCDACGRPGRNPVHAMPEAPPAETVEPEVIYVPTLPDDVADKLAEVLYDIKSALFSTGEARDGIEAQLVHVRTVVSRAQPVERVTSRPVATVALSAPSTAPVESEGEDARPNPPEGITAPMQWILDALAWLEGSGMGTAHKRVRVALVAGRHVRNKGFTNALGSLRSGGLISYPQPGTLELTDAGRDVANFPDVLATTAELQARIFRQVKAPRAAILQALIPHYPNALSRDDLADVLGKHVRNKSFTNGLGALRSLGLVAYPHPGAVVATSSLFLEGA